MGVDDEGIALYGRSRRVGRGGGELSIEGEVGAKEMNEGPDSIERLVARDLEGVYNQPRKQVEPTTPVPSTSSFSSVKETSYPSAICPCRNGAYSFGGYGQIPFLLFHFLLMSAKPEPSQRRHLPHTGR